MKSSTKSEVTLDSFPVTIDGVWCLSASKMEQAIPHLQAKDGESQDEKHVQDHDIAQLLEGQEQGVYQDFHGGHCREAAEGAEKAEGSEGGDVGYSW